ncbi:hypothetical protein HGM15179_015180 [Zosterops borbonicus]|uniref:Outer dense fiber protein 3-like protein 2 n=1 Tax=Zosterops borbonicus TaxID=364589 RepID=A0A8K1G4X3_9PASS|nr:hypothetical protein HGM15179_015180 [Zosterops borbonicus]
MGECGRGTEPLHRRDPSGRRAPAYSFGLRVGGPEGPRSPGPQYLVPPGFTARGRDRVPAFTLAGRPRERRGSNTPGPGPASYQLPAVLGPRQVIKTSAPQYSFTGRGPSIFDDKKKTPGPSKYNTVDTNVYMARAPRCTMAGRTPLGPSSDTPGPSDYTLRECRKQGPTFGIRYSDAVIPVMDSPL